MARKARIELEGGLYHVITRGNDRQNIFHSVEDHLKFLSLVGKVKHQLGFYLYAYCLMTNHIHLLIERRSETVGRTMQRILTGYSQYHNRQYHRVGHVFQGRHKAILCQSDAYLARLIRYIHMNPVRAGMVVSPDEYPYSSHRAYLGIEPSGLVDVDPVLRRFGPDKERARERYAAFMLAGLRTPDNDISICYASEEMPEKFVDETIHRMGEVDKWASKQKNQVAFNAELLISVIEDVFGLTREDFFGSSKNSRIITAKEVCILIGIESGASITEMSEIVGLDTSNTSRRCDNARKKLQTETQFAYAKTLAEKKYREKIAESQA